ncbi:hypothetical protein ACFUJR_22710 [Streptomyces sp. NPDC057271]|uniref:hypothetical protein n=1 Tax=unclassified Streptomyces TaxID=2593676 RepID=UPI00362E8945
MADRLDHELRASTAASTVTAPPPRRPGAVSPRRHTALAPDGGSMPLTASAPDPTKERS